MKIKLVQEIIDFLRFKKLGKYLGTNPVALGFVLDFLSLFEYKNRDTKLKNAVLRFAGAKIGKNVHIGANVKIYNCHNLVIKDNVAIADCNVMRCWNRIIFEEYSFTATNNVFVAGTHRTDSYEDVAENQDIYIGKGCWIGANSTFCGGGC